MDSRSGGRFKVTRLSFLLVFNVKNIQYCVSMGSLQSLGVRFRMGITLRYGFPNE